VTALALLLGAVGVLLSRPALVLGGAVGVLFGAAARAAGPPAAALAVERTVEPESADPGETARVTVTVRNEGDALLPDVRVVDGVPPALSVARGSPRHATALRPWKAVTFSYAVDAARGTHRFEPATVLVRGFTGAVERELSVPAEPAGTLSVAPRLVEGQPVPLRPQTTGFTGRVGTNVGGSGTEFHSVREYRRGDPLSRVDWGRLARTGEFATLQFREERSATVVLLVDTRTEARVAPTPTALPAVERSVAAAGEAFTALLSTGDRVGLAAYGPTGCWLAPSTGDEHRARARALLGTHEAFAPTAPDGPFLPSIARRRVQRRLPGDAQILLFSPLVDDQPADFARRLDAYGHRVTVVSPDPTAADTPGHTLAGIERELRCSALRGAGVRVVDWADEPLPAAFTRAERRWSA
jgi:uncharacterized repeat protein (TIGR01451 family)